MDFRQRLSAHFEVLLQSAKLVYPVLVSLALSYVLACQGRFCNGIAEKYHRDVPFCFNSLIGLVYLAFFNVVLVSCYAMWKQYQLFKYSSRLFAVDREQRLLVRKRAAETGNAMNQQQDLA